MRLTVYIRKKKVFTTLFPDKDENRRTTHNINLKPTYIAKLKGVIGYSQNRGFSYAFIYFLTNRSAVCPLNIYRYQLFFIFLIFIMALSRPSGMFRSLFDLLTIFHFSMCKKVPKKALFWPF